MIDLLREMFGTPEAQADPYVWGAALLGHFSIGIFLTAIIGWILGAWRGALIVTLAYLVLWEGGQLILEGSDLSDSLVDATAVACGAAVAAGAWRNCGVAVALAMLVMTAIGGAGVAQRRDDKHREDT
ncbi:hypothetical protein [Paracoccus sediminilitoris]|uniref:hypothetical protein n=1 Tax=Paracoccus sediminilitoris TaxID=2202419 RepID=UPI00272CF7C0|nr:hypothetical protein [Paracoccus sediminilitoris]